MKNELWNIVFCVNNIYSNYLRVLISSIIDNNKGNNIVFHILTDYISKINQKKILEIIKDHINFELKIYTIKNNEIKKLKTTKAWTIHTWYRILIPKVLNEEINKVLYLDVDTLVVNKLDYLFSLNMTGKAVAGVPEANYFNLDYYKKLNYNISYGYICAGTLMMNLSYWRKNNLSDRMIDWAIRNSHTIDLLDQDTINFFCHKNMSLLPLQYGVVPWFYIDERFYCNNFKDQLKQALYNPVIIHYSFCKPWEKDVPKHFMFKEWKKYNDKLKFPVKLKYKSAGVLKLKYILWNLLNHNKKEYLITFEEASKKISHE